MERRVHRLAHVCALLLAAGVLTGCTGSGSSQTRTPSDGTAAAARSGGAHGPTPKGSTAGPSGSAARRSSPSDPRKSMPEIKPATVGQVGYGPASAKDRARFAPVRKASGGLFVSSSVTTLTVSGRDVGAVAVFGVKPGLAKSAMFQDQYVVQLVTALTGSKSSPRFVRAGGEVIALSTGPTAGAAWFEGDQVVLVYREGRAPDLAGLALGVRSTPTAG